MAPGDLESLTLAEVIDVPAIQRMMDDFLGLTGMGMAIVDLQGKILVAAGWQDICTRFHRVHPETRQNCIESDTILSSGIELGSFNIYRCKSNLWDAATPITLGDRHAGNLFLGQFVFEGEEPDRELFRGQARRYRFDEEEYLAALERLPRWSRERVARAMTFFAAFARQISNLSYGNIRRAQALAQREKLLGRLNAVEQLSAVGGWEWDTSAQTMTWTDGTYRIHGFDPAKIEPGSPELIAASLACYNSEDRERVAEAFRRCTEDGQSYDLECGFTTAAGCRLWVRTTARAVRENGRIARIVGNLQDITEHKLAQESLRNRERALKRAQKIGDLGSWEWDIAEGRLAWSDELYRIWEVPTDFSLTQETIMALIHPDDRAQNAAKLEEIFESSAAEVQIEFRIVTPEGATRHLLQIIEIDRDESGKAVRAVGIMQNITERKRAEEERQKLQAQFLQAQKMESVGRLAGGVAHDFNNLLMGIMGYADLCRGELPPDHPIRPWLDEISTEVGRSSDLVRQLLAFARKQTFQPRPLDLNEQIGGMLKMLRWLIGERIELVWSPAADLRLVRADPAHIDQVLANLCVNAADAIAGTGRLEVATRNAVLDEAACAGLPGLSPGPHVQLSVADSGCGMDVATQAHAFEPFFTTKAVGRGTGLGLSTVYGIVRQSGGVVQIDTAPGAGTTVGIYLPALAGSEARTGPDGGAEALAGGSETILVVDDERCVRVTLAAQLARLGYEVLTAESPEAAIRLSREYTGSIDLLLSDMVMPGMSGADLRDRLLAERREMRALLMTGYTGQDLAGRSDGHEEKIDLRKPVPLHQLALAIRAALPPRAREVE